MKKLFLILRTWTVFMPAYLAPTAYAQEAFCDQLQGVLGRMQQIHYNPVTADAQVKADMIRLYADAADTKGMFFSQDDISTLAGIANVDGLCQAYQRSTALYTQRVKQYDSLAKLILSKPLNFAVNESITAPAVGHTPRFAEKDRTATITRVLKFKLLDMVYKKFIDDSTDINAITSLAPALEQEMRAKLLKRENILVKRLDTDETNTRLSGIFLNAMVSRYDPHSSYFSAETKSEFEESLSRDNRSFGLSLGENENFEIEVIDIAPGGPAWVSNKVHEHEILESVTDKDNVTHELQYMGMHYLAGIMRDPANKELTFNLRGTNNEKNPVTLVKATLENTENSFSGYVLSGSDTKFGYIPLPSFYTDFESDGALGCANDVAKEIILLKQENIQGLILDLRNNGGGSLKEAMEIAGLFIDEGPLGAIKPKNTKPYLLKDFNRGTIYDGPVIIMVNGLSASASEFLSGCLQDYGRAVITGTETYGKGTAQSLYPVDTFSLSPGAYLKITDSRFYHVSQRSNQARGIQPDIVVPDLYASLRFFKEQEQAYHFANDSVAKKMLFQKGETGLTPALRQSLQADIDKNPLVQQTLRLSDSLNTMLSKETSIPLTFKGCMQFLQERESFYNRMDKLHEHKTTGFTIRNHAFASELLKLDEAEKLFNARVTEELYYDPELAQAFIIFTKIISSPKN